VVFHSAGHHMCFGVCNSGKELPVFLFTPYLLSLSVMGRIIHSDVVMVPFKGNVTVFCKVASLFTGESVKILTRPQRCLSVTNTPSSCFQTANQVSSRLSLAPMSRHIRRNFSVNLHSFQCTLSAPFTFLPAVSAFYSIFCPSLLFP